MRQKKPELTEKQARTLEAIREYKREEGRAPTRLEIGARTAQRHQTGVENHLRALERKGYVQMGRGKGRTIVVVDDVMPILDEVERIPADQPIPMPVRNAETRLVDIADRMPRRPDYYLRVPGNSMSAAGIRRGDLVAVQQSDCEPADGAIVLTRDEGDVALKRFRRVSAKRVELHPESEEPGHEVQSVNTDKETLAIEGEVVGLITMEAPKAPKTDDSKT